MCEIFNSIYSFNQTAKKKKITRPVHDPYNHIIKERDRRKKKPLLEC